MSQQADTTKKGKETKTPKVSYHYKPEEMTLEAWQKALRRQAAQKEQFTITAINEKQYPGDYKVINPTNKSEYKIVFRGEDNPWNYCSCMDFKTSRLGSRRFKFYLLINRYLEER